MQATYRQLLTHKLLSLERVKRECRDRLGECKSANPGPRVSVPYRHGAGRQQYSQQVPA